MESDTKEENDSMDTYGTASEIHETSPGTINKFVAQYGMSSRGVWIKDLVMDLPIRYFKQTADGLLETDDYISIDGDEDFSLFLKDEYGEYKCRNK